MNRMNRMNRKVYVASHCRWAAEHVAHVLSAEGYEITSRWHGKPFHPTEDHPVRERQLLATEDLEDVTEADALVLVAGPQKYSGGKFVEAGIAIGQGKKVVVVGRRENMLLWLPQVAAYESPEDAAVGLR